MLDFGRNTIVKVRWRQVRVNQKFPFKTNYLTHPIQQENGNIIYKSDKS
jgi:hypothetical protein